jgi:hypothetical protein
MLKNPRRNPQNKFIGVENPSLMQPPYRPPRIGHNVNVFPITNYKELQQEAYESREIVGQLKRANLFHIKNNMASNLAYGDDTVVIDDVDVKNEQGKSILTRVEKEARIAKNNSRFDYKQSFPDLYNFKETGYFKKGRIFSSDRAQAEYLYDLDGEEIDRLNYNDKVKHDVEKMKALDLIKKVFNKGQRADNIQRIKNVLSLLHQDKTRSMTRDLPTTAGGVGEMEDQRPGVGSLFYMSDQGSDLETYDFSPDDLKLIEMWGGEMKISGDDEVKKISGDDEVKKISGGSDDEGETEVGGFKFDFVFDKNNVTRNFKKGSDYIKNSNAPTKSKRDGYNYIMNILEDRMKDERMRKNSKQAGTEEYKKAAAKIKKIDGLINTTHNNIQSLYSIQTPDKYARKTLKKY